MNYWISQHIPYDQRRLIMKVELDVDSSDSSDSSDFQYIREKELH